MPTIDDLRQIRIDKLEKLRKMGIDPYPAKVERGESLAIARDRLEKPVKVIGRIVAMRGHGGLIFADIVDESGKIQVACKEDQLEEKAFELLPLLDIGDFIAVQGNVGKTVAGEVTVFADRLQIITKSLNPLPDRWYGLKDIEERYRKRYVDMLLNREVKDRLTKRSQVIGAMREFLIKRGFIEVETPTLQPIYGGGFARPFVTHHNVLDTDFYLRISDEMYLKRLIVGGFEKVFEITKVFRNEGIDHDHNPEFTMFEAQIAYEDYSFGMDITEEIIEYTAKKILGKTAFSYQGTAMEVARPWQRYKLTEAISRFTGFDPMKWQTLSEAREAVRQMDIPEDKLSLMKQVRTLGEMIAFAFEHAVEKKLMQPTIIYDFPIEVSPLAKKCDDPRFTQRFEVFAFGSELGNNYTELNDPLDLLKRFIEEKKREAAGFAEAQQTDYDYIEAIEHGFPPTCGLGIGIDRLVMLLTDAKNIKEVIPFPTLRPQQPSGHEKKVEAQDSQVKIDNVNIISKPDYFSISADLGKAFPSLSVGIALIKGVNIKKSDPALELEKENFLELLTGLTNDVISGYKEVLSYRKLYKAMGVDWHSRRPSPEALLRRVSQGKGLYTVNTCVDAYNLVVMKNRVSVGAFDAKNVHFPTVLRFAAGGDEILLLGDKEPTKYTVWELAYYDKLGGFNIDFNYRDAQRTMVTEETKDIWINVDGIFDIIPSQVEESLKLSVNLIRKYCGGDVEFMGVVV
ncbi:lysine--tRNA ligase [Patescibacteria group bacterium]|nr:lysine--tRNA ligase [Patescibacteria group bacterium]